MFGLWYDFLRVWQACSVSSCPFTTCFYPGFLSLFFAVKAIPSACVPHACQFQGTSLHSYTPFASTRPGTKTRQACPDVVL